MIRRTPVQYQDICWTICLWTDAIVIFNQQLNRLDNKQNNNHDKILRRWRFPVGDSTWYVWWWLHLCSMRLGLATCCTGFTYRNRGEKGEELGCDQPPVENLGFQYLEIDLNFSLVWFQKIEDFSPWCEIRKMRHGFSSPLWTPRGSGSILQLGPIILSQCFPGPRWLKGWSGL